MFRTSWRGLYSSPKPPNRYHGKNIRIFVRYEIFITMVFVKCLSRLTVRYIKQFTESNIYAESPTVRSFPWDSRLHKYITDASPREHGHIRIEYGGAVYGALDSCRSSQLMQKGGTLRLEYRQGDCCPSS